MTKKAIIAAAIILPLIPLIELASQFGAELAQDEFPAILAMYYPARAFALVGFPMMFYQFVIGARLPVVEQIVDKRANLLKTHRTMGKAGFLLMLLHGLGMLLYDIYEAGEITWNLGKLLGVLGLFLIIAAVVAAWWFKPLQFKYNTWKKIHLLAYVVFPIIFIHAFLLGGTLSQSLPTRILYWAMLLCYVAIVLYKFFGPDPKTRKKKAPKAKSTGTTSPAAAQERSPQSGARADAAAGESG